MADDDDDGDDDTTFSSVTAGLPTPISPTATRRLRSTRTSDIDLRSRLPSRKPSRLHLDEQANLLAFSDGIRNYTSAPNTAGHRRLSRASSMILPKHHNRSSSIGVRLATALGFDRARGEAGLAESKVSLFTDERVWYDQFTSTDWVHDSIADAFRLRDLRSRKDFRGRLYAWFDGVQGWVLVAIIGIITALLAYFITVTEASIFELKEGFCTDQWTLKKNECCSGKHDCPAWRSWGQRLGFDGPEQLWADFLVYVAFVIFFAICSCLLTLLTRTEIPSHYSLTTLDENLAADPVPISGSEDKPAVDDHISPVHAQAAPGTVYYPAAGSGVAEVKVILSGFVVHGYLGVKTLVVKTLAVILSLASGMSLGKEGPYVHIATCVGNIACRIFSKYNHNDGKRREVLSAAAASGVGVAFGAPIGGVLFSLEEVSYYFPPKTLFRTFFCCIVASLSLKFLNPYGTGKIVIFEVRYAADWEFFEIFVFILLGVLSGALGAFFIKACAIWARTFRKIPAIKRWPVLEVALVALITGLASFWNRYTKLAVTELLFDLASPCKIDTSSGLCPDDPDEILGIIGYLSMAFVIKSLLTTITFGIKVPAGIYVPSMVVGGLLGRIVGHVVQHLVFTFPDASIWSQCAAKEGLEKCVTPGVYALVAAGATMCGVTRLSVTLAVILFELTGSLNHVLPFSLAVLVAKWTADAIEPLSIYDLLTEMNSYPLLDNKLRPVFTTDLGDITPAARSHRVIDVSNSPLVQASVLRRKLEHLHSVGELDGGLPVIRNDILVGLLPAPDLEFALDKLEDEERSLCLMVPTATWHDTEEDDDHDQDPTDFTPFIDPAPVSLDVHSPMDLVFQCFVKLGLRYICVLKDGQYAGLLHKKTFVKYIRELEHSRES
ncbi:MAG: hypothetical protein L6R36_000062 [Xanthoria steineri]|nr:MAG: hypothetical protein L6R36_000062 [Xanthoria steineri]